MIGDGKIQMRMVTNNMQPSPAVNFHVLHDTQLLHEFYHIGGIEPVTIASHQDGTVAQNFAVDRLELRNGVLKRNVFQNSKDFRIGV